MKIFIGVLLGSLLALVAPAFGAAMASLVYTPLAPLVALFVLADMPRRCAQPIGLHICLSRQSAVALLPPGRSATNHEYLGYLLAVEVH